MSFAFFFFFYLPVKGEEDPDYMSFPWSVYTFLTWKKELEGFSSEGQSDQKANEEELQ